MGVNASPKETASARSATDVLMMSKDPNILNLHPNSFLFLEDEKLQGNNELSETNTLKASKKPEKGALLCESYQ